MFYPKAESGLNCREGRLRWFPAAMHFKEKKQQKQWWVFTFGTSNGSSFKNAKENRAATGWWDVPQPGRR